jgi:hypothetical protein
MPGCWKGACCPASSSPESGPSGRLRAPRQIYLNPPMKLQHMRMKTTANETAIRLRGMTAGAVVAGAVIAVVGTAEAAVPGGAYDLAVQALNPVVRYQFEEGGGTATADNTGSAGAALDGAYTAGVSLDGTGSAFPQLGNAGTFSGSTGYVTIPTTTVFGMANKSIEFWFKRDSTIGTNNRRDLWTDKVRSGKDFGIFSDPAGANTLSIFKEHPHTGGGSGGITESGIADDAWHHLVLTMVNDDANSTWKLYIDGAQKGATMIGQSFEYDSFWDPSVKKKIGTNGDSGTDSFPGLMDEFALYPTTLTATQVADLYDAARQAVGSASFGLTITRTGSGFDLAWDSRAGKLYRIMSTADLAAALSAWSVVEENIVATPDTNTKSVDPAETTLFYIVEEYPAPPVTVFSESFDGADPGWATGANAGDTLTTQWELGTPAGGAATGPSAAHSPDNCYGTNIATDYGLNTDIWLRTPPIDLTSAAGATLVFQQFRDIETGFDDRGSVRVLRAADDTQLGADILGPIEGTSTAWQEITVDLPPAALGETIKLEFRFESDIEVNHAGWYIDDVAVTVPAP